MAKKVKVDGKIIIVPDDASIEQIKKLSKSGTFSASTSAPVEAEPPDMVERAQLIGKGALDTISGPIKALGDLPEQAGAFLDDLSPMEMINPIGKIGEGLFLGGKDRYDRLKSEMGDSELAKAGSAIGSIPILGDAMEAGVRMANPDPRISASGAGGILGSLFNTLTPLAPEIAGANLKTAGSVLQSPIAQELVPIGIGALKKGLVGGGTGMVAHRLLKRMGIDPLGDAMNYTGAKSGQVGSALDRLQPDLALNRNAMGPASVLQKSPKVSPNIAPSISSPPAQATSSIPDLSEISTFPTTYRNIKLKQASKAEALPDEALPPHSPETLAQIEADKASMVDRWIDKRKGPSLEPLPLPEGVEAKRLNSMGDLEEVSPSPVRYGPREEMKKLAEQYYEAKKSGDEVNSLRFLAEAKILSKNAPRTFRKLFEEAMQGDQ